MDIAKNFAKATLAQGYEAADTAIDVLTGEGARFPPAPFNAVWWNATDYPDPSDDPTVEVVRVTDVTDETLTVTRAQEGTAAEDHNLAGKTYKLIAGLTARTVNEDLVGDVFGSGPALIFDTDNGTVRLRVSSTEFLFMAAAGVQLQSLAASLGDIEGEGNFTSLIINDSSQLISLSGKIGTNQSASATGAVGSLAKKLPIYDESNTLLGYIPIYSSIT